MYVKLGPYKNWWVGPYQIADTLKVFGYSEDECYEIGNKLNSFKSLVDFCEWVYEHNPLKERKVVVKIDNFDVWNVDCSLSIIIAPLLKKFAEDTSSMFQVDDCDVPDELKSMNAPRVNYEYNFDINYKLRHQWLLSELIWTFEQLNPECSMEDTFYTYTEEYKLAMKANDDLSDDWLNPKGVIWDQEGYIAYNNRIQNGLNLFSRYFRHLWN
jgi:hypothetical protein